MRCKILEEVQLQSRSPFPPPRRATPSPPHRATHLPLRKTPPAFPFNIIYGVLGAGACRLNLCFFQVRMALLTGLAGKTRGLPWACQALAGGLPGNVCTFPHNKNYQKQQKLPLAIVKTNFDPVCYRQDRNRLNVLYLQKNI